MKDASMMNFAFLLIYCSTFHIVEIWDERDTPYIAGGQLEKAIFSIYNFWKNLMSHRKCTLTKIITIIDRIQSAICMICVTSGYESHIFLLKRFALLIWRPVNCLWYEVTWPWNLTDRDINHTFGNENIVYGYILIIIIDHTYGWIIWVMLYTHVCRGRFSKENRMSDIDSHIQKGDGCLDITQRVYLFVSVLA